MKKFDILEIRILPPIAIGRLGSANEPMDAYDLKLSTKKPLDFRRVIPKESFKVSPSTGKMKSFNPRKVDFKEVASIKDKDGKIHPVSPFLEVFAVTTDNKKVLVPLTTKLLKRAGLSENDIKWNVDVGNIKIYRRTGDVNDKINAELTNITHHKQLNLMGECKNFIRGKRLPLGKIQFIAPTAKHPEIRLRYTPGPGKVYGSSLVRIPGVGQKPVKDPIFNGDESLIIYNEKKGKWRGYAEGTTGDPATYTNPAQIFAGYYDDATQNQISWGYLDDECDGYVTVELTKSNKRKLKATAHISAGPPAFAPDTLPIRVVSDELEQILLGPDIDESVSIDEAEELVRRAFETVRLMNSTVMNGNAVNGLEAIASTMPRQDSNDFNRYFEPIMATSVVDNLALAALHERVYNGMGSGAAAWFGAALRQPEEIGDLSNEQRRKMPALMRGADGRALCLTRRSVNKVIKSAMNAMFDAAADQAPKIVDNPDEIPVTDLLQQIAYRGHGNPYCVLPRTAISNCFPGLEFDFRNFWRRAFDGIVLIENNNYVVGTSGKYKDLLNTRLVAIEGKPTMVGTTGPVYPHSGNIDLKTAANPNGVSFMEWSNNMAAVLQKQGKEVVCHFTKGKAETEVVVTAKDLKDRRKYKAVTLKVNNLFEKKTATFSKDTLKPGELTQGLCAPWQNDYRECACYYWAASRPDFVNVVPNEQGLSSGDNWMAKERSGEYILDDRKDSRLISYDDLFQNWEGELNFIIKGKDAIDSRGDQ